MTCVECGGPTPRRARFCPRCGATVERSAEVTLAAPERHQRTPASRRTRAWAVAGVVVGLVAVLAVVRPFSSDRDPDVTAPTPRDPPGLAVGVRASDCAPDERGCVAWRLSVDGGAFTGAALVGRTGYVGVDLRQDGGGVVAFSVATGEVLWSRRTNRPVQLHPAADDATVIVVEEPPIGQDSVVNAFAAATGERRWRSRVSFRAMFPPTVVDRHAAVAGYPPAGVALGLDDPTRTTPLPVDGPVRGPLVGHDGIAYVALDERLAAVDLRGDGRDWEAAGPASPADRVTRGVLVVTDADGSVVAFDATTGVETWRTDLAAAPVPPLVRDGRVIVAGDDELTVLDPATGAVRYRRRAPSPAPDALEAHERTVYHLSETVLTAVSLADPGGAPPVWSHTFADGAPRDAPAVSADGTRLVIATPRELVAFVP